MPKLTSNTRSTIYNVAKDTHLRISGDFGGGDAAVEILNESYEWEPLTDNGVAMVYTSTVDKFLRFTGSARVSIELTGATNPAVEYHFYGAPVHEC